MILTACDGSYLEDAKFLISSCARHEPNQRFYLYLVNAPNIPDSLITRWHPNIIIERTNWHYEPHKWRSLMCMARSLPILRSLENYREKVIYLDSDIIIRAPLKKLWKALDQYDLLVKHRPQSNHLGAAGTRHASKFNNGVIVINATEGGLRFAKQYHQNLTNYIESGRPLELHLMKDNIVSIVDQELLYVTYLNLKEEIRFQPLPEGFNDSRFHQRSVVWHGKGTARNHPMFRLEKLRYKNRFLYFTMYPASISLALLRHVRFFAKRILGGVA